MIVISATMQIDAIFIINYATINDNWYCLNHRCYIYSKFLLMNIMRLNQKCNKRMKNDIKISKYSEIVEDPPTFTSEV